MAKDAKKVPDPYKSQVLRPPLGGKQSPKGGRPKWRKVVDPLMVSILIMCFTSVFGTWLVEELPWNIELPLGKLESIAVDSVGNVYCSSQYRIQAYDRNGKFIRAYGKGMPFRRVYSIYVDSQDHLYAWRTGRWREYDITGKVVVEGKDVKPPVPPEYQGGDIRQTTDSAGNTYRIASFSWLFPRVIRERTTGRSSVVVSQPWYLWLIQAPYPAFSFGFVGAIYLITISRNKRKSRQSGKKEANSHRKCNDG